MNASPVHLLVVALIVIVLFGAGRLGEVGKGLGAGIRNFKKGIAGDDDAPPEEDAKQLKGKKAKTDDDAVEEKKEKA